MGIFKYILFISSAIGIVLTGNGLAAQEYNSLSEDISINYAVRVGGRCTQLLLGNEDLTSYCQDYFVQMSLKNGRVIYMIPINEDEDVFMTLSGEQTQQPRLNRFTLFLDTSRLIKGERTESEVRVVGTCEMYGNPDKEQTTHECVVQQTDEAEMHFQFISDPNKIVVVN